MNTKISNFPSKTLYHSRLTSHTSNASRLLCHLPGVSQEDEYDDVVGAGSEVVFWDTAGAEFWERSENDEDVSVKSSSDDGGSLCNVNEAEVVKHWVHRLVSLFLSFMISHIDMLHHRWQQVCALPRSRSSRRERPYNEWHILVFVLTVTVVHKLPGTITNALHIAARTRIRNWDR
jgi:AAA domain